MKTKITFLKLSYIGLSLLSIAGAVYALPAVESHSHFGWKPAALEESTGQNPSLELLKKLEYLQQEVQELRGKVEEQSYQLAQLKGDQKKLYLDLDKRLQDLSPTRVTAQEEEHPAGPLNVSSHVSSIAREESLVEERAYQQAYHLVQSRDYDGAAAAFRSMVKTFPRGKYLPNAYYWLGEIYLSKGELVLAFQSFESVYKQYPQHPKAADSLLKLGYVEYAKGQWKRSHTLLSQVKTEFPGSTSAQLADARLQRMQKEGRI